jgi:hypothetical protein
MMTPVPPHRHRTEADNSDAASAAGVDNDSGDNDGGDDGMTQEAGLHAERTTANCQARAPWCASTTVARGPGGG